MALVPIVTIETQKHEEQVGISPALAPFEEELARVLLQKGKVTSQLMAARV
jgi:hypothetical protein